MIARHRDSRLSHGFMATCSASGRAVTRFNSDLISGRCWCTYDTSNVSPRRLPHHRSRFHDQTARYLLYLSPWSLLFPGKRFLRGMAPLDAATLAPYTPTHTFTFRPQENARTHAYTRTTRKCNACITRTSTMMSGEFAPGGARMYGTPTIVHYIRYHHVEGVSDSSPLESACIYGRDDMTAACEILRPGWKVLGNV